MSENFKKLKQIVASSTLVPDADKKKVLACLAVVLLGFSFSDLTEGFNKSEDKIRNVVTIYAHRLGKNKAFEGVMFSINKEYNAQQRLNFVA